MLERRNVAKLFDLVVWAQALGYEWNEADRILVDAEILDPHIDEPAEIALEDFRDSDHGLCPDSELIVTSFMAAHGVKSFLPTR